MKRRVDVKFFTCPGSRIHQHYEPQFDGQRVVLIESGTTDIQTEIESFGRYTDLHYMLHRLSVGDRSVLTQRTPVYGDFSNLPTNPIDAINLMHSAESRFAELSMEERAAFNNDYRAWLASVLSGETSSCNPDSAGDPVDPVIDPVDSVVKKEES